MLAKNQSIFYPLFMHVALPGCEFARSITIGWEHSEAEYPISSVVRSANLQQGEGKPCPVKEK